MALLIDIRIIPEIDNPFNTYSWSQIQKLQDINLYVSNEE
jgi:hypothetical protein